MPNGLIGKALLTSAGGWTLLGAALAEDSIVNIRFANANATPARVSVAIGTGAATDAGNLCTPAFPVAGNCPYEDTAFSCSTGEKIWAKSDTDNVTVRAHGVKT